MSIELINTAQDMKWLRDVHLPRLHSKYKSAVIHGNMDWPSLIEVYVKRNPLVTDLPVSYVADDDGMFRVQSVAAQRNPAPKRMSRAKKSRK